MVTRMIMVIRTPQEGVKESCLEKQADVFSLLGGLSSYHHYHHKHHHTCDHNHCHYNNHLSHQHHVNIHLNEHYHHIHHRHHCHAAQHHHGHVNHDKLPGGGLGGRETGAGVVAGHTSSVEEIIIIVIVTMFSDAFNSKLDSL